MTETAIIFVVVSTVILFTLAIAWSKETLLNLLLKVGLFLMSFTGAFVLFQHFGVVVVAG